MFSYLKNLPLTIQTRVLSSVEKRLLFVVSPITNADMVMFKQRDAMRQVNNCPHWMQQMPRL